VNVIAFQCLSEFSGVALAPRSQRQICESRVLACEAPGGLTVSGEIDHRKFCTAHLYGFSLEFPGGDDMCNVHSDVSQIAALA
jgi:hypothetical protein